MSFLILTSLRKSAQTFRLDLEGLEQQSQAPEPDWVQVQGYLDSLQSLIKNQWANLSPEALPKPLSLSWLSLQTEIQRSWQLLLTDSHFWRAAVKARRPFQHQARLQGHIQRLRDYGQYLEQLMDQCASPSE
ncbi:heterocyst frequency control protein PatD [Synechocystis sp. LKSZ1]|uniref:heterocyst frequency control protein PatD n=1 Tax=Synechocystis sp. LKSZ1 TaxID=3144951 RepID=UPI00336BD572